MGQTLSGELGDLLPRPRLSSQYGTDTSRDGASSPARGYRTLDHCLIRRI